MFTLIFVSMYVISWLFLGFIPWLALSVATRGNAGLLNLPLCLFTAVVAGLAVPLLGKDDFAGLWISGLAAIAAPSALLAVRRFSMGAREPVASRSEAPGK